MTKTMTVYGPDLWVNDEAIEPIDPDGYYYRQSDADAEIERLRAALTAAKVSHHICDDCWYSCPKSSEGCCDEREKDCNCGAEKHNAAIDSALSYAVEPVVTQGPDLSPIDVEEKPR
jgi:hypothetical protein